MNPAAERVEVDMGAGAAVDRAPFNHATILEHISDALIVVDMALRVTYWGPGAEAFYGVRAVEALGRRIDGLLQVRWLDPADEHAARSALLGRGRWRGEHVHVLRDGEERHVDASISMLRDERGEVTGFVGVVHDETARARLYESEILARAEAQESSAAKDQLLALLSHELRNPLTVLQTGLHIVRRDAQLAGRPARAMEILDRNVALLTRLVNDMLDLSRVTRGQLQLQRAPVALEEVARAAAQAYEVEAHDAGLALHLAAEPGLWVMGDLDRLQQVLMNLIANALKFTGPGGTVTVRSERARDGLARLVVEDTGIGLEPARLAKVFEMFEQGEVGARRRPGLGIGLTLVKGIVERHGGKAWAESEGVGRGSRFLIELPLVSGPEPSRPGDPRRQEPGHLAKILLVEDSADTRHLIADALRLSGHDVLTAESGEEALSILSEQRPDLLLCDIGLPGMDGHELLRQARALPGLAAMPAFAVTGHGEQQDVERSRKAGFLGHFVKPVDVGMLDRRIRAWLGV